MDISKWKRVRLGDVAENISQRVNDVSKSNYDRWVGLSYIDKGTVYVSRYANTSEATSSGKIFREGDVLLPRRFARSKSALEERRCGVATFEGVCSGDAYVIREQSDSIVPGLLKYVLNTDEFWEYAVSHADGSMSTRVKWKDLELYEFSMGEVEEMMKITKLLDSLAEVSEKFKQVGKNNSKLRSKIETQIFSDLLNEGEGSIIVKLGDVTSHVSDGPFGSKLKSEHYTDTGVRVVRLGNIGNGEFISIDEAYISEEYHSKELTSYTLKTNDIVLAGLGDDKNLIGRNFMVDESILPAIHKADCFCIRPTHLIHPKFLMYYLNSSVCQLEMKRFAQGGTRLRLNGTNLKKVKVPLPPLDYQQKIVEFISLSRNTSNMWDLHPLTDDKLLKHVIEIKLGRLDVI